uniref:Serine and arginine rich splicing factor 7b n=1 Tax=Hucho hucho TaxID=62062 RepID=A0A4W5M0H5_9TELE
MNTWDALRGLHFNAISTFVQLLTATLLILSLGEWEIKGLSEQKSVSCSSGGTSFYFSFADAKVYVGNLGTGAGKGELERAFGYYGPLRTVWIARNPPGFAFVEFEDTRDAEDAVRGLDGKLISGSRVRVELSTGMPRRSRYERAPTNRPFDSNDKCYECGERGHYAYDCHRYSRRRRTRFRRLIQSVTILNDFMRHLANSTLSILL